MEPELTAVVLEDLSVVIEEEAGPDAEDAEPAILAELVIEELSIDGMCGVY